LDRLPKTDRLILILKDLLDNPGRLFPLSFFSNRTGAAKSSISEDVALIRKALEANGLGQIRTVPGAAGGVLYLPGVREEERASLCRELVTALSDPRRILPGGFLYTSDIIFSPTWSNRIGRVFASWFAEEAPDYVITVETKGIPLALMTARALGAGLVIIRRDSRVTEGPVVTINYLSGSSGKIQTMSLPRRALRSGAKVLIVDDFMRAGGTAAGMLEIVREFDARACGIAVLIQTAEPSEKMVPKPTSLLTLKRIDVQKGQVDIEPTQV